MYNKIENFNVEKFNQTFKNRYKKWIIILTIIYNNLQHKDEYIK